MGPQLAENFGNTWSRYKSNIDVDTKFEFDLVSENEVFRIVKDIKLSKSCALDNLSTRLVNDAFEVIIPAITHLFNKCLMLGDIPESWCVGRITPIPKATK